MNSTIFHQTNENYRTCCSLYIVPPHVIAELTAGIEGFWTQGAAMRPDPKVNATLMSSQGTHAQV